MIFSIKIICKKTRQISFFLLMGSRFSLKKLKTFLQFICRVEILEAYSFPLPVSKLILRQCLISENVALVSSSTTQAPMLVPTPLTADSDLLASSG